MCSPLAAIIQTDLKKAKFVDSSLIERLVVRCRRGDDAAWRQMVDLHQNLVYSVVRRMGLNDDECGDVFQQTFLALYRSLDRIEDAGRIPKWLAVTASREALKQRRNRSSTPLSEDLEAVLESEEASAEALAIEGVEADGVRLALMELGGRCKELLTHLYIEELSYQELAEKGFPMGSIGPTRARCLEKLRRILEREEILIPVSNPRERLSK